MELSDEGQYLLTSNNPQQEETTEIQEVGKHVLMSKVGIHSTMSTSSQQQEGSKLTEIRELNKENNEKISQDEIICTKEKESNLDDKNARDLGSSVNIDLPEQNNISTEDINEPYNQDVLDEISEFNDAEEVIEESSSDISYQAISMPEIEQSSTMPKEAEKEFSVQEKIPQESSSVSRITNEETVGQEKAHPSPSKNTQKYKPTGNLEEIIEKLVQKKLKGYFKESKDLNHGKVLPDKISPCVEEGCQYHTCQGKNILKRHRRLKHLAGPIPHKDCVCPFRECFYSTHKKTDICKHILDEHNTKCKIRTWWFQEDEVKPPTEGVENRNINDILEELTCSYEGCAFEAFNLNGLKKHITMKHLKPRQGPKKKKK